MVNVRSSQPWDTKIVVQLNFSFPVHDCIWHSARTIRTFPVTILKKSAGSPKADAANGCSGRRRACLL